MKNELMHRVFSLLHDVVLMTIKINDDLDVRTRFSSLLADRTSLTARSTEEEGTGILSFDLRFAK